MIFRNLFNLYLRIVTQSPKLVLLVIALLTVGLAAGLPNFKLDASAESLTLEHDTDLDYFRKIAKDYSSGDFLVVTFKPHDDLFSETSLDLLASLSNELGKVSNVSSMNTILNVPLLYSGDQGLTEIVNNPLYLRSPGLDKAKAKEEFLTSPIYKNLILSPDGQTTALQMNIAVDQKYLALVQERDALRRKAGQEGLSLDEQQRLAYVSQEFLDYRTLSETKSRERVQQVRKIVAKYKDRAQIFLGGVSMITADMVTFIQSDLVVFGLAVILFMITVLAVIFRTLRFVVIPMLCCVTAVIMMLGYVSWLDWRLTVISSNFVALLLITSLAIIIHLVVRYREYVTENPEWSREELVVATVKFMIRPCLYTALTTMVAFMSLVVSDIRPVIDFGWMMTMGLVVALLLAFLVLPSLLVLLPKQQVSISSLNKSASTPTKPLTGYFADIVEKKGRWVVSGALAITVLSGWGITQLQVENRFIDYFHKSTEIYQGLSVIDNNLGGTTSLDIVINVDPADLGLGSFASDEDDPFAESVSLEDDPFADDPFADDPFASDDNASTVPTVPTAPGYWMSIAGLKKIEWLHDYLESMPEVGKVQSLAVLYKVGKHINGGLNDFELTLLGNNLPQNVKSVIVSPYIADEGNQTRITMRIKDSYPGLKRAELVERMKAHIEHSDVIKLENVRFTGLLVLYNNMLQSLFSSQIVTMGVVFFGILVMFLILFRSIKLSLVAITPNILAAAFILGAMGIIGLPLDMMTITVAAISVGMGVDNAIHYIHRFKEELAVDGDYIAAMHRSHRSIGRAMYYTSIIIVVGFGIMVLSRFIPTIYFGLLTSFAMLAALMGALLLLPKLILIFKPFGKV